LNMARKFNPFVEGGKLTVQQTQVAKQIAMGLTNRAIAMEMGISIKTVEYYRTEIFRRVRVQGVAELTHWALAMGLVENKFEPEAINIVQSANAGQNHVETESLGRPEWTRVYREESAAVVGLPKTSYGIDRHGEAL
jgi:DNA-binding CsgD family transcriptional regulator